jgi:hypothetical protein
MPPALSWWARCTALIQFLIQPALAGFLLSPTTGGQLCLKAKTEAGCKFLKLATLFATG